MKYNDIYNIQIRSLYHSTKNKLYFWQLYNLLGEEVITNIIYRFYEKILNDTEYKWFSDVFRDTGTLEYHVMGQKRFWFECMGGGNIIKRVKKHYIINIPKLKI